MHCDIKTLEEKKHELQLRFTFEDKMDRELTSELKEGELEGRSEAECGCIIPNYFCCSADDEPKNLAWDLVFNGLASEVSLGLRTNQPINV